MTEGITFAPSPVFYVVIGLIVGLIIGWTLGFFDSNNRTAKKIEAAEKNAEIKMREAEDRIRKAAEQSAPSSQASVQDDPGLLRLKNEGGYYALELDGAPVKGSLSPEGRKRLIDLLTIIRPYLEGAQPQVPVQKPAVTPQTPPAAVSTSQAVPPQRPISRPAPPQEVKPVAPTLGSILSPAKKPPVEEKPFASLSIVEQIDSILQARLASSPLAGKGIRMHESLQGGVEVYVGLQKFESVDDVPDESIKSMIRAAIAEWEEKYTPGV
jgi:hypothetical protein